MASRRTPSSASRSARRVLVKALRVVFGSSGSPPAALEPVLQPHPRAVAPERPVAIGVQHQVTGSPAARYASTSRDTLASNAGLLRRAHRAHRAASALNDPCTSITSSAARSIGSFFFAPMVSLALRGMCISPTRPEANRPDPHP